MLVFMTAVMARAICRHKFSKPVYALLPTMAVNSSVKLLPFEISQIFCTKMQKYMHSFSLMALLVVSSWSFKSREAISVKHLMDSILD